MRKAHLGWRLDPLGGSLDAKRVVEVLEALVKLPKMSLVGVPKGVPVARGLMGDVPKLFKLHGGNAEPITSDLVSFSAIPPYDASDIYFARDVTKGMERHKVYKVDIDKKEEVEVEMEPVRVMSVVQRNRVFFSGSKERNSVYLVEDGKAVELASFPSFVTLTDTRGDEAVGFGAFRGNPNSWEILLIDSTGSYKIFTPKEGSINTAPIFYRDKILFESNFEGENKLYLWDPESGSVEELRVGGDYEKFSPIEHQFYWLGSRGELIIIGKRDGRSRVFVDGKDAGGPLGNYYSAFVYEGTVYATFTNSRTPTSVMKLPDEFLFKAEPPEWLKDAVKEVEFRKIKSFDGLEVPAFIIKSGFASLPGPSVLLIHGGPWAEDDDRFDSLAFSIAACGFHVIKPNYRGSTGYGRDYMMKILGDPCGGELKDIISVTEALKGEVIDKACIMGYSYGGYMTLCALTKYPDEYECGVAGAAVIDWKEMYELSDAAFKSFIDLLFAGRKELFEERSPIKYVENLKAPLCIVHPQNDTRTPLKPALKLMERLADLGKDFEAHVIPETGHALRDVDVAIKMFLPTLLFLITKAGRAPSSSQA